MDKQSSLLEEMNSFQVNKTVNSDSIALLVFGACENHGDHMPFGSDFIFPLELAKRISIKIRNLIILPPIPYGVSLHHKKFFMTINLEPNTLVNLIENIFSSLIDNGIKKILIINGHDGNIAPIEIASRNTKDKFPKVTIACLESWWTLVGELSSNLFEVWNGMGHGGEAETSAMLYVRPDLVTIKRAPADTIPNLPEHVRIYWNIDELTKTGATGASKKATTKKGKVIIQILEDLLVSFIENMEKTEWKYGIHLKSH
ncbi:MAG: creatininase family protein [Nitrososphaeraceae archaeon]|nr:creatininase family protein [Nitrososphaeraceae archaeon]